MFLPPLFRNAVLLSCAVSLAAQTQPGHDAFATRFNEIKRQATREQLYAFLSALPKGGDLHNHNDYSVFAEFRYEAATDKARLHGNEYFTRVRVGNCPSDRQPPLLFETVQRSTYRRLSGCVRADFEPLAGLSSDLRERWISAMKLDQPGEGRNEFFEGIVPRTGDLTRDPYLVPDLLVEDMQRFGAEGLRYLETQAGPSFQDRDGHPLDVEA